MIRVLDAAKRAAQRWSCVPTDFLTPSVHADCVTALKSMASSDIGFLSFGGHANAERSRLMVGRQDSLPELHLGLPSSDRQQHIEEAREELVAAIEIKGNFIFDPASHPDFLGAILGTGIQRGKVGDILVLGESGAQALVDPLLLDHFTSCLNQVRTVPVKVSRIPLTGLKVREPKMEEAQTVEASTRLDALASFGFRVSRSKMGELIKSGDVKVNWVVEERTARDLKEGDVVSCTGRGRIQVSEVDVTRKDRFRVNLKRFI